MWSSDGGATRHRHGRSNGGADSAHQRPRPLGGSTCSGVGAAAPQTKINMCMNENGRV